MAAAMRVSVVIPVYQAAAYVAQAAESALAQPETLEVILVEDNSPDDSLAVCARLAAKHPTVRLFRHAGRRPRGPGASRNRGLREARGEWMVCLDADDYFLPGRFETAHKLLADDPALDGVYEAVGSHFETPADEQRWRRYQSDNLTTMRRRVAPEALFEAMTPIGPHGYCALAGWVFRRAMLDRAGMFDAHLWVHQDTAFLIRLAATGRMAPGRLEEPVMMRRVHPGNAGGAKRPWLVGYYQRTLMWATLAAWGWRHLRGPRRTLLTKKLIATLYRYRHIG
jgi:glycosyltransferase involved in cell wall biosynthesis